MKVDSYQAFKSFNPINIDILDKKFWLSKSVRGTATLAYLNIIYGNDCRSKNYYYYVKIFGGVQSFIVLILLN